MTTGAWIRFLIAGLCWGVLGFLLGRRAFGPELWAGVFAAPFIGVVVGALGQGSFARSSGFWRAVVALLSLYLGASLFAVAIGLAGWGATGRPLAVWDSVLGVWWGVTMTGFVLFLWPLAYFTHWVIYWQTELR